MTIIEIYPEKRKDGCWVKKIVFNFPVPVNGEDVIEYSLESLTTVECVVSMQRKLNTNEEIVKKGIEYMSASKKN